MDPADVHAVQLFERHLGTRLGFRHQRALVGIVTRAVEIDYGGSLGQDHTSETRPPGPARNPTRLRGAAWLDAPRLDVSDAPVTAKV